MKAQDQPGIFIPIAVIASGHPLQKSSGSLAHLSSVCWREFRRCLPGLPLPTTWARPAAQGLCRLFAAVGDQRALFGKKRRMDGEKGVAAPSRGIKALCAERIARDGQQRGRVLTALCQIILCNTRTAAGPAGGSDQNGRRKDVCPEEYVSAVVQPNANKIERDVHYGYLHRRIHAGDLLPSGRHRQRSIGLAETAASWTGKF